MEKEPPGIEALTDPQQIPFDLLQLADPCDTKINAYLSTGTCYVARLDSEIVGAMVLGEIDASTVEIKNIAVKESAQGQGIGKALLRHADRVSRSACYDRLIIGTGNSSIGQLALYQKEGFEITCIQKNFFLENYDTAIFEHGIRCKHKIMLEKIINQITDTAQSDR